MCEKSYEYSEWGCRRLIVYLRQPFVVCTSEATLNCDLIGILLGQYGFVSCVLHATFRRFILEHIAVLFRGITWTLLEVTAGIAVIRITHVITLAILGEFFLKVTVDSLVRCLPVILDNKQPRSLRCLGQKLTELLG